MYDYFNRYNLERIKSVPSLSDFAEIVFDNYSYNIKNLESALSNLVKNNFMDQLLNYELDKLQETLYTPNPSSFSFLNLLDCKHVSLYLFYSKGENFINRQKSSSNSTDRIIASLVRNETVEYSLFKQENPFPLDILDKSKNLSFFKKGSLRYSETIFLNQNNDILKFDEDGNKHLVMLMLFSKQESSFIWEYRNSDNRPDKIVTGSNHISRFEHTCRLLGELGNIESLVHLKKFLSYPEFNIRWEAAKAIMLISFEEGVEVLETLKNDPHPDIRQVVNSSLKRIKKF